MTNYVCYCFAGQPLNINAAYSGRIACAYKYGKSFTRPSRKDPDSRYVNLCVAIYECESTGGKLSYILICNTILFMWVGSTQLESRSGEWSRERHFTLWLETTNLYLCHKEG